MAMKEKVVVVVQQVRSERQRQSMAQPCVACSLAAYRHGSRRRTWMQQRQQQQQQQRGLGLWRPSAWVQRRSWAVAWLGQWRNRERSVVLARLAVSYAVAACAVVGAVVAIGSM